MNPIERLLSGLMQKAKTVVTCGACKQKNRVDAARMLDGARPRCGGCGLPLKLGSK